MTSLLLHGFGLHGGKETSVELVRAPGPVSLTLSASLERDGTPPRSVLEFQAISGPFATRVTCESMVIETCEHLFAALAGMNVRAGCRVVLRGGSELPLLGGGALEFVNALARLELVEAPPTLRVVRRGRLEVDGSIYELSPGDDVRVEVDVELPPSCDPYASWNGSPSSFVPIARARTFALEADMPELTRLGVARHVDPKSVLVVGHDVIWGAPPIARDEPARHKLLDLIGDAYLYGGPPRGTLRARRPGHARNHHAFRRALEDGILAKDEA